MLKNLKKALDDKNISLTAYASVLGISQKSAWNKVYEETPVTYPEAKKTKTELFPEYDFEYLFASDGNTREVVWKEAENQVGNMEKILYTLMMAAGIIIAIIKIAAYAKIAFT